MLARAHGFNSRFRQTITRQRFIRHFPDNGECLKKFVTDKFVSKQFHVISEHYDNWIRGWGDDGKTFSYFINPKLDDIETTYTFFTEEYIGDDLEKIFS